MKSRPNSLVLSLAALALLTIGPSFAQGQQQIFQDERLMQNEDQGQQMQYQNELQNYEQQVQNRDSSTNAYRLYAEERIDALQKLKSAGGSPSKALTQQKQGQMYALEQWLKNDNTTRAQEQQRIRQLEQAIGNLQQSQNAAMANMNASINSMRENEQARADDDKFNKMMAINQFNELQSEMGAASWGRPPTDGTFNSVGGYGMGGGYGYSFGGGRRW